MSNKYLDIVKVCCEICDSDTERMISKTQGKPIVISTYNESADAYFTGPAQKQRVLKEKGLVEAPNLTKEWSGHKAQRKPYADPRRR